MPYRVKNYNFKANADLEKIWMKALEQPPGTPLRFRSEHAAGLMLRLYEWRKAAYTHYSDDTPLIEALSAKALRRVRDNITLEIYDKHHVEFE